MSVFIKTSRLFSSLSNRVLRQELASSKNLSIFSLNISLDSLDSLNTRSIIFWQAENEFEFDYTYVPLIELKFDLLTIKFGLQQIELGLTLFKVHIHWFVYIGWIRYGCL